MHRKERHEFTYEDPKFLNNLVMYFSEERCDLSASLKPDVPDFLESFEILNPRKKVEITKEAHELRKKWNVDENNLGDIAKILKMTKVCEEHGIIPFYALNFNYDFRQFDEPEIKYVGFKFGDWADSEPRKTFRDPGIFVGNKKWYGISFKKFKGENIGRMKQAITGFIDEGYVVTSIRADLDSRTRSAGHYFDHTESKASLLASNGEITIYGEVPEGFSEANVKEWIQSNQKTLSKPQSLLEKLNS